MPDNDYIEEQFSLLAKLMDIHGENPFKVKSYSSAAFAIGKLPRQLSEISPEELTSIKGIGDAIGKKILGILSTGKLGLLEEYLEKTPPGVIEMLNIKGLGPKKIATIWKEMGIESIGELLYACEENRLLLYKGFGEKTQKNTRDTIEFYLRSQGIHLFAEVEDFAWKMDKTLHDHFTYAQFVLTGEFRRQLETVDHLDWVTTLDYQKLRDFLESIHFISDPETAPPSSGSNPDGSSLSNLQDSGLKAFTGPLPPIAHFTSPEGLSIRFYCCTADTFYSTLFLTSCSPVFLKAWTENSTWNPLLPFQSEEEIFRTAAIPFIPAPAREDGSVIDAAKENKLPEVLQATDIQAIIHSHSQWSDGSNSLEEMARACIDKGFEYLVISDHSKSAFYANGLKEDRIHEQQLQIDSLNATLSPFRIFKSIECDILNDGQLDYSDDILSTFDLVIASVHSNLKMKEEKAMARLMKAIENPYTTILGHMTGRLLLSRPGYPLDMKKIIDACAANSVAIELNAHPRRLDIDWRWIGYALEKEVLISIDPDAHSIQGYNDIKYGVLVAQKAGLTKERNLSSFSLTRFEEFLAARKKAKGL